MQRSLLLFAGCCLQLATPFTPSFAVRTVKESPKSKLPPINALRSVRSHSNIVPNHNQRIAALSSTSNDIDEDDDEVEKEKKRVREEIFWAKQRALAAEMTAKADAGLKREQQEKFAKRRLALTSDTLYFSILIASVLWLASSNPFVPLSYLFGALSGTAYSYGLGKYVETIGGSIDDTEAEGAGIGQARFAFLILLFVVVGKFRDQGLLEIPSILGFFTYQLASLGQGLREIDD
ncbi:hypothetical protein HJC23_010759 [Cyclotella cryptica]|uniref:ATP synthase protein I n=1 Tax=Cyclotella cryptica TaxID=29204 RepID=A0ABD3PW59_9STRA|eukprot:CCRYP_011102-RA/>CCRYP_011102-RA protein AED:0.41 eAED:0.41 QI:140/1/1/1/0.5/0.33/3/372/234